MSLSGARPLLPLLFKDPAEGAVRMTTWPIHVQMTQNPSSRLIPQRQKRHNHFSRPDGHTGARLCAAAGQPVSVLGTSK